MTEPPANVPPDPTADPPPFSTPQSPPYPADDGGYPTYRPGSAPVQPPPAYPPVTAVPAYGPPPPARGSHRLAVGLAVTVVVALAMCGLIGAGAFVLLGGRDSNATSSGPLPAATVPAGEGAPTHFPTFFPTEVPSWFAGTPDSTPHEIVYEVTGAAATAEVAYFGVDEIAAGTQQVNLPWRKEITTSGGPLPISLTALGEPGETLTCRITVDGQPAATDTGELMVVCIGLVR